MNMPTQEAEERGRGRARRARLASVANVLTKVVTIGTSFATIPLTLHYLGPERFGLWMTVSSFVALLSFVDFGLGNGLLNALASAFGRDDRREMRRLISNAAAMLTAVALAVVAVLVPLVLSGQLDLAKLLGLRSPAAIEEAPRALVAFIVVFALNVFSGFVQRAQLALQLGAMAALSNAAGALLGLLGVLLAVRYDAGLPGLIAALIGAPVISTWATGVWFFWRSHADLSPRWRDLDRPTMRRLLSIGGLFFVLQVAGAIGFGSDNAVAARYAGAEAAGDFAVAAKLFGVVSLVLTLILAPLWPAYAEAIARRDIAWVRHALRQSLWQAGLLSLLGASAVLIAFGLITDIWLQRQLAVPFALLAGLFAWTVIGSIGNAVAMFLNGSEIVKSQVVIATLFAVVCLPAKAVMAERYGVAAIPWTTTVAYILTTLIPYALMLPGMLAALGGRARSRPERSGFVPETES